MLDVDIEEVILQAEDNKIMNTKINQFLKKYASVCHVISLLKFKAS